MSLLSTFRFLNKASVCHALRFSSALYRSGYQPQSAALVTRNYSRFSSGKDIFEARTIYPDDPSGLSPLGLHAAGGGGGTGGGGRSEGPATIPLAAVEVRADGEAVARYVQKNDAASLLQVPARDLRAIDPSFQSGGGSLLPRERVIIVGLMHVRVLICADYVLVFDPLNPHVDRFIPALRTRLASRTHPMPFEFRALEAVLVEVCADLNRTLGQLVPSADAALMKLSRADLTGGLSFEMSLDQLLPLQGELHDFADRVDATRGALLDTLSSDEDLSLLYLSTFARTGHRRRVDEHDEAEMMLENYVKQVDAIRAEVRSTLRAIAATENITQIRLDAMRNRVLRLEVLLNLAALSVTTGTLVAGAFGMNMPHGFEDHPYAFWVVFALAGTASVATFSGTRAWLRWRRIF